jgi:hypothetical protein
VLALALIPVLGVDVLLEARSRTALEKLARAAAPFADVVRDVRGQWASHFAAKESWPTGHRWVNDYPVEVRDVALAGPTSL